MMKLSIRSMVVAAVVSAIPLASAFSQASQRGQPRTAYTLPDFAKLRWLEGTWEGTAPGEAPTYQKYVMSNDSTIDITYYSDPALTHETGTGKLYLSVARVAYTFGPSRWGATHVDADGVFLVPQVNARNSFSWSVQSPDSWTSTQRSGVSGRDRVLVYQMKRLKR